MNSEREVVQHLGCHGLAADRQSHRRQSLLLGDVQELRLGDPAGHALQGHHAHRAIDVAALPGGQRFTKSQRGFSRELRPDVGSSRPQCIRHRGAGRPTETLAHGRPAAFPDPSVDCPVQAGRCSADPAVDPAVELGVFQPLAEWCQADA